MSVLLVVTQSRTGGTSALTDAIVAGATDDAIDGVEVVVRPALEATVDETLAADGYVLATPEHFGYVSGAMKHYLETIYHPCLDRTRGRPYALVVKAGNDGTGTVTSVERILAGLAWRAVVAPVIAVGEVTDDHLAAATDLGGTIAAGLSLGIY